MAKFAVKLLLLAVVVTQVFGAVLVVRPVAQPKKAEAFVSSISGMSKGMGVAASVTSVPGNETFSWHKFTDDIFTNVMLGVAHGFTQRTMQIFIDRLSDKYKIRNFLYYDQILTNYYLTNFIRDKISDPDLRQIYVLMETEFIYGQPNGTTPGSSGIDRRQAVVPRLRTAIAELYKKQTGIDPALIANPPESMSNRDYLAQSQSFYFNNPGYTESNLRANFGAFQSAATTAAQLEVLVGNSLKAGRFVGGYCDIIGQEEKEGQDSSINTPQKCEANGGQWKQSSVDEARSFIDNPTAYVDSWMQAFSKELTGSNFDPNNFWFAIGNAFGRFLTGRLFIDRPIGVLMEDERGYEPVTDLGQGTTDMALGLDIDGDDRADGYDIDGDGIIDNCIYGGTAPDCEGSSGVYGDGGGGACAGVPMPERYQSELESAEAEVNSTNPGGIADAMNTEENGDIYLNEVASVLRSRGFEATTRVKNGHGRETRGELIAVWETGDAMAERYDAIRDSRSGAIKLRDAAQADYVNHVNFVDCIY